MAEIDRPFVSDLCFLCVENPVPIPHFLENSILVFV